MFISSIQYLHALFTIILEDIEILYKVTVGRKCISFSTVSQKQFSGLRQDQFYIILGNCFKSTPPPSYIKSEINNNNKTIVYFSKDEIWSQRPSQWHLDKCFGIQKRAILIIDNIQDISRYSWVGANHSYIHVYCI